MTKARKNRKPAGVNLDSLENQRRIEAILEAYADMTGKAAILHALTKGSADLEPVGLTTAYALWNAAMDTLKKAEGLDPAACARRHRARLLSLAKAAKKAGAHAAAQAALDRVAILEGVPVSEPKAPAPDGPQVVPGAQPGAQAFTIILPQPVAPDQWPAAKPS